MGALSSAGDATFRTGLYGDVKPVEDLSEHTWKIYCLDKASGKVLWEQVAFKGLPKVKRHTKVVTGEFDARHRRNARRRALRLALADSSRGT